MAMQSSLDLFSVIIFLGVVQGVFLCLFCLARSNPFAVSNRFMGLLLFALAAISLEIFLE